MNTPILCCTNVVASSATRAPHACRLARRWAGFALILALAPIASASQLVFGPPQFLPGDTAFGPASGHQEEMEIAAGGSGSLAVWSDARSGLDNLT